MCGERRRRYGERRGSAGQEHPPLPYVPLRHRARDGAARHRGTGDDDGDLGLPGLRHAGAPQLPHRGATRLDAARRGLLTAREREPQAAVGSGAGSSASASTCGPRTPTTSSSSASTSVIARRFSTTAPSAAAGETTARSSVYVAVSRTPSPDGANTARTATIAPAALAPPR